MVNRLLIERVLSDIKSNIADLQGATDISWEVYQTNKRSRRFVERTLHILVEACIDLAQHIISDEGFREPDSYRDAFIVLAENGIVSHRHLEKYEHMAAFRNLIVHYYERVDDEIVFGIFKNDLSDFILFSDSIKEYLERQT